jgi:hypothetical protein
VQAGWDDVPHLTEQDKTDLLSSLAPHQRDARTKGIPSLGAGAIYPVPEEDVFIDPFQIPRHFRRLYGLDVGWKKTAAIWLAHDLDTDVIYGYSEHYRGQAEPSVHAAAIRARGVWIPGAIDTAARGRSQKDGETLWQNYEDLGLNLIKANKAVEAGILEVYERLSTGRLKLFKTLQNTLSEYRIYRRDTNGRIVKENDHVMDAMRYGVMKITDAITQPTGNEYFHENIIGDRVAGY